MDPSTASTDESADRQDMETMPGIPPKKKRKAPRPDSPTQSTETDVHQNIPVDDQDIDVINIPIQELIEKLDEVTFTETMVAQLRERFVSMSTEERRKYYFYGDRFLISEQIASWLETGQTDNEGASNVLFEPDALLNTKVALWEGDIRRLELDVIVVVGWGRVLLPETNPLMELELDTVPGYKAHREPIITAGYCWPAKYVYHLPDYPGAGVETVKHFYRLQFTMVLDYIKQRGHRTLAFECDTLIGFQDTPLKILLKTARKWLEDNHTHVDKIVFCVNHYNKPGVFEMVKESMHTAFPVCHTAVTKPQTLPVEILRMDDQSILLYKKALSEGETSFHSIRAMVVGHYDVGKTTLTKRLLGEEVDLGARNSTDGIDVHVGRCRVSIADQKWTVLKKEEKVDTVSRKLVQLLAKQRISDTTKEVTVETAGKSADTEGLHDVTAPKTVDDDTSNANTAEVVPTNDTIPKTPVEYVQGNTAEHAVIKDLQYLKDFVSNIRKSEDNEYADVSFWDFGGQAVFYTTHQTFLSPRAIYILVTDISKVIDDIVVEGDEGDEEYYFDSKRAESYKIKEFFNYWMDSIHARCPSGKVGVPRVILVATHADKLDQERRKELEDKYFEAVRHTFDGKVTYMHVVDADFAIDNTIVDPNIAALQQKIYEVASQQDYWGERIPANWLTVERALGELCDKGLMIITRAKLQEVNNEMPVPIATEDALDVFLRFQHDTANYLYFNEAGLRDHILLDPRLLVDSLKSLITAKAFCSKKPEISRQWKELYREGILRQELIEAVWTQKEMQTFWNHKDHLLQLMQKLNIIAQMDGQTHVGCYLVPCMLKEPPPILMKDDCTRTQNLCINTEDGFLPAVIFQGLMAGCVSKWKISRQKGKNLIYCGYGCFDIDNFHRMMLYFSDSTIQIWVSCYNKDMPGPNPDLCAEVREYVLQTLQKIITCLSLSQCSNLEQSIKCPDIQELNELPEDGMFKIDELVKQRSDGNVIICHAHEESHNVRCSDLLQHWYGENIRRESDDDNCTGEKLLTDKQLSNIACKIGKEYQQLGFELGLSHEKIDQIKLNNPYDVIMQTTKILLAWKESAGCQATFGVLEQAMITVDIDTTTALAGIK